MRFISTRTIVRSPGHQRREAVSILDLAAPSRSHSPSTSRGYRAGASTYDFTSQLFFNASLLTQIYPSVQPYTDKGDAGRLRNSSDGIFNQGGSQLLLDPQQSGGGYAATFNLGLVI